MPAKTARLARHGSRNGGRAENRTVSARRDLLNRAAGCFKCTVQLRRPLPAPLGLCAQSEPRRLFPRHRLALGYVQSSRDDFFPRCLSYAQSSRDAPSTPPGLCAQSDRDDSSRAAAGCFKRAVRPRRLLPAPPRLCAVQPRRLFPRRLGYARSPTATTLPAPPVVSSAQSSRDAPSRAAWAMRAVRPRRLFPRPPPVVSSAQSDPRRPFPRRLGYARSPTATTLPAPPGLCAQSDRDAPSRAA